MWPKYPNDARRTPRLAKTSTTCRASNGAMPAAKGDLSRYAASFAIRAAFSRASSIVPTM
jgi:hypothetical protein